MRSYKNVAEYKPTEGEKNDGEVVVEIGTYITPKAQIEAFILSGQRLEDNRKDRYDFEGDQIDEGFEDPTRKKCFDMAEGSMIINAVAESVNEVEANKKQK